MPVGKQVINGLRDGLRTLPYVGGKSNFGGAGEWIMRVLETKPVSTYVEPFGGMCGLLLRRSPVRTEVVGDLDNRVVNFFQVVRDQPDALVTRLEMTPYNSHSEFQWAKDNLQAADPVERAVAVFVVLLNAMPASLIERSVYRFRASSQWALPDDVLHLARRLRAVRFVCEDGVALTHRYIGDLDTLIYIDPPYPGTLGYDHDVAIDSLIACISDDNRKAHVAVGGFADSYPALEAAGYIKVTKNIHLQMEYPTPHRYQRREEALFLTWNPQTKV